MRRPLLGDGTLAVCVPPLLPISPATRSPRYPRCAVAALLSRAQATSGGFTISSFTYLRLDDTLLQPGNLGTFQQFVSTMNGL
jgi:hypothetical protein